MSGFGACAALACVLLGQDASAPVSKARPRPVFVVAPPISEADQQWMAQAMELSEAQRAVVDSLLQMHRTKYEQCRTIDLKELREFGADVVDRGEQPADWLKMMAMQDELIRKFESIDAAAFAQVGDVLSESQQFGLDRARMRRSRSIASGIRSLAPAVTIDLTALVDEMARSSMIVILDPEQFLEESVLYEREVTPLMRMRFDAVLRIRREDNGFHAILQRELTDSIAALKARRAMDANYRELQRIERRIHNINVAYVDRLGVAVSAEDAQALRQSFRVLAYPNIYPNPFDAALAAMAVVKNLPEGDERNGLMAELMKWRELEERLGQEMVSVQLAWLREFSRTRAMNQPAYSQYESDLLAFQGERRAASERLMTRLAALPAKYISDEARSAIQAVKQAISEHTPRRNGSIFFP